MYRENLYTLSNARNTFTFCGKCSGNSKGEEGNETRMIRTMEKYFKRKRKLWFLEKEREKIITSGMKTDRTTDRGI